MLFQPIRVITRPKKNGLGTHFGVEFPNGEVYDYTIDGGFRSISDGVFADGETVTVVREIPWHQAPLVKARLADLLRNPRKYDLLTWNCETFAEWLTSGVPKSAQVIGTIVLAGTILALVLAMRS